MSHFDPKATFPSTNCCGASFFALMLAAEKVPRVSYGSIPPRGVTLPPRHILYATLVF